jgi:hypothetical protein
MTIGLRWVCLLDFRSIIYKDKVWNGGFFIPRSPFDLTSTSTGGICWIVGSEHRNYTIILLPDARSIKFSLIGPIFVETSKGAFPASQARISPTAAHLRAYNSGYPATSLLLFLAFLPETYGKWQRLMPAPRNVMRRASSPKLNSPQRPCVPCISAASESDN